MTTQNIAALNLHRHSAFHPACSLCGRCLWNHLCAVERTPAGSSTCELPQAGGPYCDEGQPKP